MKKISSKEMKGIRKDVIECDSFGCGSLTWRTVASGFDEGMCNYWQLLEDENGSNEGQRTIYLMDKEAVGTNK